MKHTLCIITLLMLSLPLRAQFPMELWHEGRVVLESGDTLRGMVKYDLDNNAIRLALPDNTEKTFTAHKAWYFEIFDKTVNMYREFFALPYRIRPGYETMVYFEALQKGDITLLSREKLVQRTRPTAPYNYYRQSYTYTELDYDYFTLKEGSELKVLSTKRKDVLHLMGKYQPQVRKFIQSHKLRTDERTDLVRTFSYYNALVAEDERGEARNN